MQISACLIARILATKVDYMSDEHGVEWSEVKQTVFSLITQKLSELVNILPLVIKETRPIG